MPIGSSLGITLPTVGVTAGPAWATSINAALQTIITAIETRVTPSGLNLNDDVEFNLNEALEVGSIQLENKASAFTGAANIVKIYVYNGELYYNDGSGNAVQITSGGNVNRTALGSIGGDYGGSDPAALNFTASTSTYLFLENTVGALRALIDVGQILLRASGTAGYAIKLTNPGTLVADITRTFAAALPASTSVVTVSPTGQEVLTRSPSLDAVTIADDAVLHADLTKTLPAFTGHATAPANVTYQITGVVSVTGATELIIPIPLEVGERLKSVSLMGDENAGGTFTLAVYKNRTNAGAAVPSQLGSTDTSNGGGTTDTLLVSGLTELGTSTYFYFALVGSLASGNEVHQLEYVVDRIA